MRGKPSGFPLMFYAIRLCRQFIYPAAAPAGEVFIPALFRVPGGDVVARSGVEMDWFLESLVFFWRKP